MRNRAWSLCVAGLGLIAALAMTACEYYSETTPNVSGVWDITDSYGGVGVLRLSQSGNTVSGSLSGEGSSVPISGTLNGNNITLRMQGSGISITLYGTVNGDMMSGTFTQSNGPSGSWSATRR